MKQPTAPPTGIPLYPELPITDDGTAGVSTSATSGGNVNVASQQPDQYFRLQEISRLRKHLEDEKDKRSQLYKKYRRGINAVDAVDTALISASMGMGIGGVGLLTTVIAAPVVLGLEIAALGCGLLGVAGKFISRWLSVKAKKHDEVRVLAESKLNTIADHVSRALTDGQISDEEFRLISDEAQKYTQMKAEIRTGAQKAHAAVTLDEESKNSLIQRGRDEARASFMKKLAGPWVVCSFGTPGRWHVTAHASTRTEGMTRPRGAPRPARGWSVLSGAPGVFCCESTWFGGPPGGWGGPFMVNQNWVWELLWGSQSFPQKLRPSLGLGEIPVDRVFGRTSPALGFSCVLPKV